MIYKVHEGCEVCWPDGSCRAKEGEVFDGLDTEGSKRSRDFASAILASYRDMIYTVDEPCSDGEVPAAIAAEFEAMAGSMEAVASAAEKKAEAKPKRTRRKAATKTEAAPEDSETEASD